ncbi:MAG: ROK family protein [Firmicutes bacterium]|jgi:polyphosphate glucokinase|nr:ROK family protein [Bacillota bacterium]
MKEKTLDTILTLSVDVGGTGIKASVLDSDGQMVAKRVRIATPYPFKPENLLDIIGQLSSQLPAYDRISIGFPGVVRKGKILTAPHFVSRTGPGIKIEPDPELLSLWTGFDLDKGVADLLAKPVKSANDAELQGIAVIEGKGLELVLTLGTGLGSALFYNGQVAPHLELAHHPFRKGETYNDQLGNAALEKVGQDKWCLRVAIAIENFKILLNYDRCYVGGGNAEFLEGFLNEEVTFVKNIAGILGGIKLWEEGLFPYS